jgi:hypothetical protein
MSIKCIFFLFVTSKNLEYCKIAVSLQCVFHSIRFKVNKRLGLSGAPFFMSIPQK